MFEDLFRDPVTIASHWAAPLLEERLSYLRHCVQTGVRPRTLRRIAAHQTSLARCLGWFPSDFSTVETDVVQRQERQIVQSWLNSIVVVQSNP